MVGSICRMLARVVPPSPDAAVEPAVDPAVVAPPLAAELAAVVALLAVVGELLAAVVDVVFFDELPHAARKAGAATAATPAPPSAPSNLRRVILPSLGPLPSCSSMIAIPFSSHRPLRRRRKFFD